MKKLILSAFMLGFALFAGAQNAGDIKLPEPNLNRGTNVMKALKDRKSDRTCNGKELSLNDLSDLVWAANGVNRPADGKRTAPSALNKQDIDVYVITAKGAYKYIAATHTLQLVAEGDHRSAVAGGQDFVNKFPVSLVMVSDLSKFGKGAIEAGLTGAIDAGIVSQNVCIFCSSVGLKTVPRMSMDKEELAKVLKLNENQLPLMNTPVGY